MQPPSTPELDREPLPEVPLPTGAAVPRGLVYRIVQLFPGGQFVRYLLIGGFNTLFGYLSYAVILTLLGDAIPPRYLSLSVVVASILSTPLNITVAYFGYKLFVFRTRGNYLREYLKCFAVYGTSMIPGLIALGALTRLLQQLIHHHGASLHHQLASAEAHLSGRPLAVAHHLATGRNVAGYLAGAIVIGVSTIYSFVGHKKVTFAAAGSSPGAV